MIWSWLKPLPEMAAAGHAATHTPQPWQSLGLISVTIAPSSKVMALKGQRSLQMRQPEQRSASTVARYGSMAISPWAMRLRMVAAAAAPLETLVGMSRGPSVAPAAKTPSVMVATGSSLAWRSMMKPLVLQPTPKRRATSVASGCGSRPADRMTMSAGTRRLIPASVSSTCTMSRPSWPSSSG